MPKYKVTAPGYHGGHLYHPEGKRKVLITDKPFSKKNMPSWVKLMKSETAEEKEARKAKEAAESKEAAEKAEQDQKDIKEASFLGEGEGAPPAKSGVVETL
jgi:hypothetical protein